jgi:dihydropteroate synthase
LSTDNKGEIPLPTFLKGLGEKPLIMGILNIAPDSFSDGGKYYDPDAAIEHALAMAQEGADIIDIGGESSRPGANDISVEDEITRVLPVIKEVCRRIEKPVSIDTVNSEVAELAIAAGASIINDISALRVDEKIGQIAAKYGAYLILMHMRGTPRDMQDNTDYDDIMGEVSRFLADSSKRALGMGVPRDKIIIDPGIGFGKSAEGNFTILRNLHRFQELGFPLMIGVSRKSFIGKTLDLDVDERLEGSLAAACYAVLNGADIVRVHDVAATVRALTVVEKITGAERT